MQPASSSEAYHRGELRVALDPAHPAHILPPPLPRSSRVLDIGCGAGQTMIAAYSDRISFGIDVDEGALLVGRSLSDQVRFTRGRAETLPFRDASFDFVVARVSLAYTNLFPSLREIRRVLRRGGRVWMTLHPFRIAWEQARRGNVKGWIFFAYLLVNSALFDVLQRQVAFLGRYESFQTEGGIRRALARAGFTDVDVQMGRHFVVTAAADA